MRSFCVGVGGLRVPFCGIDKVIVVCGDINVAHDIRTVVILIVQFCIFEAHFAVHSKSVSQIVFVEIDMWLGFLVVSFTEQVRWAAWLLVSLIILCFLKLFTDLRFNLRHPAGFEC